MTEITLYKETETSAWKGIQVFGHADSVDEGYDLVCCAISVLTINLVNSMEMLTQDDFEVIEDEETGLIRLTLKDEASDEARLLLDSFELGILYIAQQYDEWLNVKVEEV